MIWLLVFSFCSFALYKHGVDIVGALFIAVIVSIFHTAIVKYIFDEVALLELAKAKVIRDWLVDDD